MKILTETEGEKWLLDNNLPVDQGKLRFLYNDYLAYEFPMGAKQRQILAKGLINIMQEIDPQMEKEGVFWITGLMGEDEYLDLCNAYRKSMNENRPLLEAPFHIFGKSDLFNLECLLVLTFYFGWIAYLISPNRETVVLIQEEWFIDVTCKNKDNYQSYREFFEFLKLKKIKNSL